MNYKKNSNLFFCEIIEYYYYYFNFIVLYNKFYVNLFLLCLEK